MYVPRPSKVDSKLIDFADAMLDDPSIVFVLLLNRLEFIRERDSAMASYSLNETRAQLCELLATKLLRHRAAGAANSTLGLLEMSKALVGGFHAFQGASAEVRTFPLFCGLVAQFTPPTGRGTGSAKGRIHCWNGRRRSGRIERSRIGDSW